MTRVAVIGAGPCGLSKLREFQSTQQNGVEIPEVDCFDKQNDWGGLWNYTWRTGTGECGEMAAVCTAIFGPMALSGGPRETEPGDTLSPTKPADFLSTDLLQSKATHVSLYFVALHQNESSGQDVCTPCEDLIALNFIYIAFCAKKYTIAESIVDAEKLSTI